VVKQRRQVGLDKTWQAAVSSLLIFRGLTGFYMGWAAMALRDMPEFSMALILIIRVFHLTSNKVRISHFCFVPQAQTHHRSLHWVAGQ
jgi:hypothetical protein